MQIVMNSKSQRDILTVFAAKLIQNHGNVRILIFDPIKA